VTRSALPGGVGIALLAATLFGVSTPLAKLLLGANLPPILLAALLYLGSGVGLSVVYFLRRARSEEASLTRSDLPWLAGAVLFGGIIGPSLLMFGLQVTPAAVAGACLAWGIDNNLTQKVSATNPFQIAAIKGGVAGTVNLVIALALGVRLPASPPIAMALVLAPTNTSRTSITDMTEHNWNRTKP
jgi:hypothetical protein